MLIVIMASWVSGIVPVTVAVSFALFRKFAPARTKPAHHRKIGSQLPTGMFAAMTIGMGLVIAVGGYFVLLGTNHLIGRIDGPGLLKIYPTEAWWVFAPAFSALAVPWPLGIVILRKLGYEEDADSIEAEGSRKSGFDCFRVTVGMVLFIAVPILLFTLSGLPARTTYTDTEIRYTAYGSLKPQVFQYKHATKAILLNGYTDGKGHPTDQFDMVLEFSDDRRFLASSLHDGGESPSRAEVNLLLQKTGLTPEGPHPWKELPRL